MAWLAVPRRVRLAAGYAFLVTAVEAAVAAGVTVAWRESDIRSFDAELLGVAYDASQRLGKSPEEDARFVAREAAARFPAALYVHVQDAEGRTLGTSNEELSRLLPPPQGPRFPERAAFSDIRPAPLPAGFAADPVVRHVALPFRDEDGDLYVVHVVARTTGDAQLGRDLVARLAWIVPLGLVAAFIAAWFLERRTMGPVREVAAATAAVGPGTLRHGIEVADAEGEVAHLQSVLNDALRRLDDAFEAQSRFAANVSHELKTPIAVLLTQAQTLDPEKASREEVAAFRASVEAELRRLGRTVETFLVLSRPGGETQLARAEPTSLLDVVLEAVRGGTALAEQYGVTILPRFDLAADAQGEPVAPVLSGDADLLRTLFDNLLANAIRFSPRGAVIDVVVASTAERATVTVRDRGPGIPPDYVERVFDRFVQAPVASPRSGGFGIGLSIAATAARVHGGTIVARNCEDGGCEFVTALPLVPAPAG